MDNNQFINARFNQIKKDLINIKDQIDHLQQYLNTKPSSELHLQLVDLDEYFNFLLQNASDN